MTQQLERKSLDSPDGSSSHHSPKSLAEFEKLLILVIVVGM